VIVHIFTNTNNNYSSH